MRLLILGGTGLLGHMLWRRARSRGVDVWVTLRGQAAASPAPDLWARPGVVEGVDAATPGAIARAIDHVRPTAVVNCIGITKALTGAAGEARTRAINTHLPHEVAADTVRRGIRFLHLSTDCVFDGARGGYRETDAPDARDLYGRSKADGEPTGPGVLTLRTSMVGRELAGSTGLLEWFLAQRGGRAAGFRQVRFSGLATPVLADLLIDLAGRAESLTGLYHVAADPIDKHRLLQLFNRAFDAGVAIDAQDVPRCDRTLDGRAFRAATGFVAPDWPSMVDGLRLDDEPYRLWRTRA